MKWALGAKPVAIALVLAGCNVVLGIERASDPDDALGAGAAGAGAAGGNASSAGTGGLPAAGGAGAEPGTGGQGGGAVSSPGLLGKPCSTPSARACDRRADKLVLLCDGSPLIWRTLELCDGLFMCDGRSEAEAPNTHGSCQPIVPVCAGQRPGAVVCEGARRHVCGPDLVTSVAGECASAQLCELGGNPGCATCLPGSFACEGGLLRTCAPDLRSLVDVQDCGSPALCNAGAGQCTDQVCVSGQYACSDATLSLCRPDQSGFDPASTCSSAALCDALNGQCDACVPNSRGCVNASSVSVCSGDGQSASAVPCDATTPHCVGNGQCVQCVQPSDCGGTVGVCKRRTCSGNACGIQNLEDGTFCGAGKECINGLCQGSSLKTDPTAACPTGTIPVRWGPPPPLP
ncbi:MAG TPA: hypothetical protein VFS00_26225 [Polyangiaceae bacterium]|nr:hypothetical protein [Polyangiaceae bacterium]